MVLASSFDLEGTSLSAASHGNSEESVQSPRVALGILQIVVAMLSVPRLLACLLSRSSPEPSPVLYQPRLLTFKTLGFQPC